MSEQGNMIQEDAVEAAAKAYAEETFYHAWTALPEWARESCRDTARQQLEGAATVLHVGGAE